MGGEEERNEGEEKEGQDNTALTATVEPFLPTPLVSTI